MINVIDWSIAPDAREALDGAIAAEWIGHHPRPHACPRPSARVAPIPIPSPAVRPA